jgi:hypothetical protein
VKFPPKIQHLMLYQKQWTHLIEITFTLMNYKRSTSAMAFTIKEIRNMSFNEVKFPSTLNTKTNFP